LADIQMINTLIASLAVIGYAQGTE